MIKAHRRTIRYHRLSFPMILAIYILLALIWLLGVSAGGTALAAPDRGEKSVDAAPVAADDTYTTTGYALLDIPAPGVLNNDSDPDGDPLMAILDSGPGVGSLTLDSNGAFTYQPVPGFVGTDTFTYIAADGDAPAQAYWPFEEGSGNTTGDITGNGYDGTLMNGPLFTTTVPVTPTFTNNYALEYDGVDDYVDILIDVSETAYAVTMWVNTTCPNCGIYSVDDGLLGSGGSDRHLFLNGGNVCARVWNNETICSSGINVADGNWHHLAHTFGGEISGQQIYIDGQLQISGTKASSNFDWQTGINIGFSNDAASNYLDGLIDDLRIYMTPLTQAQVAVAMTSDQLALGSRATANITIPTGALSGEVTESSNGNSIADATIVATFNPSVFYTTQSNISGIYNLAIPAETYTVTAEAFGYAPKQFTSVSVPPGLTTTLDITLDRNNHYAVDGVVTDANTGWPLYASIDIDGYPGDPIWTDPETGYYSISLPEGITYTFNAQAWENGYLGENRDIGPLTADTTEDFALGVDSQNCLVPGYTAHNIFYDGFESGDLIAGGWMTTTTNVGRVQVSTDYAHEGDYSVLLDSAVDGAYSTAGIIKPIDLSAEPQVYLNFWWQEFGDENDIEDGVFLSDDGGSTWCPVFSFNNGPSNYINTNIDLSAAATTCSMSLGADTQILFQFYDNFAIPTDGYSIDEVKLRSSELGVCAPPADGGLVVGHVYDDNTMETLNGAIVENEDGYTAEAVETPFDINVDDAFYTLFSPSGSKTFTATMSSSYGPDVDNVTIMMSDTVNHDFYLPAGWLSADPEMFYITLDMGLSTTVPLNLSNTGGNGAGFEIVENNRGFQPVLHASQRIFVDISQVGPEISISLDTDGGKSVIAGREAGLMGQILAPTTPNAWVLIPSMPVGASRPAGATVDGKFYVIGGEPSGGVRSGDVQIFDPDTGLWDNTAPKMPVGASNICAAVIDSVIYIPGGYDGTSGITDLQVFRTDSLTWETITSDPLPTANFASACAAYDDKLYVFGGDAEAHWVYDPHAPAGSRWDISLNPAPVASSYGSALAVNDLIFYSGLGITSNLPNVYAYDPASDTWITYPSLNTGRGGAGMWAIGDMLYVGGGGWSSYQTSVEVYDTSLDIGGSWSFTNPLLQGRRTFAYASSPTTGQLFVGAGWAGAYLSEAEETEFPPINPDVPWLFEDPITGTIDMSANTQIDVTFDAGVPEVTQPGEYYATLNIRNDTPYTTLGIPVTMMVNTPEAWGKVAGTLTQLGYCDADPATAVNREILIEGSSGFTATTKTDENGYYQWWIDPSESPLTITVPPTSVSEEGMESGVMIIAGQTTSVDFSLRWRQPCVSVDPTSFQKVLFLGDALTDSLELSNGGALSTTFDITETSKLTWFSTDPLTGVVNADSMVPINTIFDSSMLTETGWYSGELRVDSDDPVHGSIWIPLDMVVVSGTPGVALSPDSTLVGQPGVLVTHTFTVTNSGDVTDIYDLALTGNSWGTTELPANTGLVDPGEIFTFTVTVEIPNNPALRSAIIGSDSFSVVATSQLDGSNATAMGTSLAEVAAGVSLSGDQYGSGIVGTTITYSLQVTNTGEFTDTLALVVSGNVWTTELSESTLTLGAGASGDLFVTVTILVDATDGDFDIATVTATSTGDTGATDEAVLTTTAIQYWINLPLIYKP